jgi:hypothetical protein
LASPNKTKVNETSAVGRRSRPTALALSLFFSHGIISSRSNNIPKKISEAIYKVRWLSNSAIIDVKESHIKRSQVVEQFLGKTTGPLRNTRLTLSLEPTIIPFYPHRVFFSRLMIVLRKRRDKAVPIIRWYLVVAYSHLFYLLYSIFWPFLDPSSPAQARSGPYPIW